MWCAGGRVGTDEPGRAIRGRCDQGSQCRPAGLAVRRVGTNYPFATIAVTSTTRTANRAPRGPCASMVPVLAVPTGVKEKSRLTMETTPTRGVHPPSACYPRRRGNP